MLFPGGLSLLILTGWLFLNMERMPGSQEAWRWCRSAGTCRETLGKSLPPVWLLMPQMGSEWLADTPLGQFSSHIPCSSPFLDLF